MSSVAFIVSGAWSVGFGRNRAGREWSTIAGMAVHGVLTAERRSLGRMTILVAVAQIESNECAVAIPKITTIYHLGRMVELVSISWQVLVIAIQIIMGGPGGGAISQMFGP